MSGRVSNSDILWWGWNRGSEASEYRPTLPSVGFILCSGLSASMKFCCASQWNIEHSIALSLVAPYVINTTEGYSRAMPSRLPYCDSFPSPSLADLHTLEGNAWSCEPAIHEKVPCAIQKPEYVAEQVAGGDPTLPMTVDHVNINQEVKVQILFIKYR